jgi:hypothetical protein
MASVALLPGVIERIVEVLGPEHRDTPGEFAEAVAREGRVVYGR